jgi:hypothetical protein
MNMQITHQSSLRVTACLAAALSLAHPAHAQSTWNVIKDKAGVCQISVPPNWTRFSVPGMANSPDHTTLQILSNSGHRFRKFDSETLSLLNIGALFENSAKRVFYVTKPNGSVPPLITYHVEVPGRQGSCVAQIPLTPQYSEEEAKRIAMSLAPAL